LTVARGAGPEDVESISETPQASDNSSPGDGIVLEREDVTIENGPSTGKSGAVAFKEAKDPGPKNKKAISWMDIPPALSDNVLLKVFQASESAVT